MDPNAPQTTQASNLATAPLPDPANQGSTTPPGYHRAGDLYPHEQEAKDLRDKLVALIDAGLTVELVRKIAHYMNTVNVQEPPALPKG